MPEVHENQEGEQSIPTPTVDGMAGAELRNLDCGRDSMSRIGIALRTLREENALSTRDVEAASAALARKYQDRRYKVPISRLCEFEKRGATPSIYRLYSLAAIYHRDLNQLLRLYSVGSDSASHPSITSFAIQPSSDSDSPAQSQNVTIPRKASFGARKTRYLGQIADKIGQIFSFAYLQQFANPNFTYGYVGSEDWTMYPLLPPASLVQIDESRKHVLSGGWASEYERPIYFVEMRQKHACCWCTVSRDFIILQPHPLSPVRPKVFQHHDAEVLGQVVGAVLMLGPKRLVPGSRVLPK